MFLVYMFLVLFRQLFFLLTCFVLFQNVCFILFYLINMLLIPACMLKRDREDENLNGRGSGEDLEGVRGKKRQPEYIA